MTPRITRGPAATDGIDAVLTLFAKSDGFGAVVELAIKLNVWSMPTRVARKQANAAAKHAMPHQINHRVERDGGLSEVVSPGW